MMTAIEPRKSEIYVNAAFQAIHERGVLGTVERGLWKAWLYVRPWEASYGFHSALLLATFLAACAWRRACSSPPAILATALWLGLLFGSVLTFYLGRYRFLSTPAVLLLASMGLDWTRRALHVQNTKVPDGPKERCSGANPFESESLDGFGGR
jgi:hypothetical protein